MLFRNTYLLFKKIIIKKKIYMVYIYMELLHTLVFAAILPGTAFWRMKHTAAYM